RAPAAAPAAGSWNDPFADGPAADKRPAKRAAAPAPAPKAKSEPAARPATWKDPFTEAPAPSRGAVAMRDSSAARPQPTAAAPPADSHASRWGVIKKRR